MTSEGHKALKFTRAQHPNEDPQPKHFLAKSLTRNENVVLTLSMTGITTAVVVVASVSRVSLHASTTCLQLALAILTKHGLTLTTIEVLENAVVECVVAITGVWWIKSIGIVVEWGRLL